MVNEKDEKDLEIINYSDIKYNDFNDWLTDALYYQLGIVFTNNDLDYDNTKRQLDIRDLDIKFRYENDYIDDDFDIAVYCKVKDEENWVYLDNIREEFYNKKGE